MKKSPATPSCKRHRFPSEVIRHCVWLYFRFCLSYRDVEEMMAERGVVLTYESICRWCLKFGQTYANRLRQRCGQPGDKWHLDEVLLTINGRIHYLWRRAALQHGEVGASTGLSAGLLTRNLSSGSGIWNGWRGMLFCAGRPVSP